MSSRSVCSVIAAAMVMAACSNQPAPLDQPSQLSGVKVQLGSVTLTVVNTTGQPYQIGGMPSFTPAIPQTTHGVMIVGTAPAGTSCFALPSSVDVVATSEATGRVDTARWISSSSLSLTASTESAALQSSTFVPDAGAAWKMTVSATGISIDPGTACTP
jgi:hypothetical protein